ncbi:MAG: acetate--CoA ligase family protein [Proteobacteria bacterium]|nr:acetate--CoA ligase family protein [Pseudomonadota bacterium]
MLDALFKPRSVAVIGASNKEFSIGNSVVTNLQTYGYTGAIYPINPSSPEILGLKAYPNLSEVPGPVDLAHIILPSKLVPQAMIECGEKGVKAVIINSAGFKEMGDEGAKLQQEFMANARKYGVRVFGPNCQGIINTDPDLKAYCNFTNFLPKPGAISVVALSGGVGALIMQGLVDIGVGVRIYASNGNACDVSISEIVRYLGNDPQTKVIIVYTEGFADPGEFLQVAAEVAARKPILAMKAGRTEQGAKAASSHTGSLAGVDIATELIFEKTGILSFADEGDLIRAAMAFASQPIPRGKRVGIITNTGGPAVIATDVLVAAGLEVPVLSGESIAKLRASLLPQAAVENPVDVVATAGPAHFRAALDIMNDDDGVDAIFMNFVTPSFSDTQAIAREIVAVSLQGKKPIVCNFMTDIRQERFQVTQRILLDGGVPCYAYPSDAARALGALARYGRIQSHPVSRPEVFADIDAAKARTIVAVAKKAGRAILSAQEVYGILEAYRIPVAPWTVVETVAEAVAAADKLGYPLVVKVDCEAIDHKSDMGGVVIGLQDAEALRATVNDMQARLAHLALHSHLGKLRFFLQKFLPGGQELIVGASVARGLGHMMMFGIGGIHVEVLKDVVFKLAPLTRYEAESMLGSIKSAALLDGVRGKPPVFKQGLVNVIQRLSMLLADLPMIQEMDLNPIMAFEDSVFVVDGRIRI